MELESRHQCLIYEGAPSKQLAALAAIIQQKLAEGYRCLYLNSRPMVAGMRSYLAAKGVDVVNEIAQARLVLSSETLGSEDLGFDVDLMLQKLADAVDQALNDGYKGLWATGDMTWELGHEKNFDKLLEYEWGLEELFHKQPALCGICQYHRDSLPREVTRNGLLAHKTIFVNETLSRVNQHYLPPGLSSSSQKATKSELDAMILSLCQLQDTKS